MINISLQPEYVLSIGGFLVTNTFLTSFVVTLLLSLCGLAFYIFRHKNENRYLFLKFWHIVVFELLRLADSITRDRELSKRLLPLMATLFIFIVCTNLIALLPGFLGAWFVETPDGPVSLFRSPNSDLTTTLALSLVTVGAIQYFSFTTLGGREYVRRFFNVSGFLACMLGIFELLSEVMRLLSFAFRLFGNVFAGEVLLLVISFLLPLVIPVPFMVLEVFVSCMQAYIFCILALSYIRLSTHHTTQKRITETPTREALVS